MKAFETRRVPDGCEIQEFRAPVIHTYSVIWVVEINHDRAAAWARAKFAKDTPSEPEAQLAIADALTTLATQLRVAADSARSGTGRRACV